MFAGMLKKNRRKRIEHKNGKTMEKITGKIFNIFRTKRADLGRRHFQRLYYYDLNLIVSAIVTYPTEIDNQSHPTDKCLSL